MLPRYYTVLQDQHGNALSGATVTVTRYTGEDATLYADRNGATALGTNVLTSNSRGEVSFYAAAGYYTLDVSLSGYEDYSLGDVMLPAVDARLTAEYFGIAAGTTADISAPLQAWIEELLGGPVASVDSASARAGVIELPYMNAKAQCLTHPAISIIGDSRGGTVLNLPDSAASLGGDAQRAMFYVVARRRGTSAASAWVPQFENLLLVGNRDNQGTNACPGIYLEPASNDPGYGGDTTPYSSMQGRNLEVYQFSGTGIVSKSGRQRMTLYGRCRSSQHGILSGNTVVTLANGLEYWGNDPVIADSGFGSCTGHGILMRGGSGLVLHGCNVFASRARSNNAMALLCKNINGATITGNVFNDTVRFEADLADDAQWRGIVFSGNDFRPNTGVFSSDGSPNGTASASANAFIVVDNVKNTVIGPCTYNAALDGNRYEYLASFITGASGHIEIPALTDSTRKPWHTGNPVPLYVGGGSTPLYTMRDLTNRVHRFNGEIVAGLADNTAPPTGYALVVGDESLFLQPAHLKRGHALIWAESVGNDAVADDDTYTVPATRTENYLNNALPIDDLTVQLPDAPNDGQEYVATTRGGIARLVPLPGAGQTVLGPATYFLGPGQSVSWRFKASDASWWPKTGGEAPATIPAGNGGTTLRAWHHRREVVVDNTGASTIFLPGDVFPGWKAAVSKSPGSLGAVTIKTQAAYPSSAIWNPNSGADYVLATGASVEVICTQNATGTNAQFVIR